MSKDRITTMVNSVETSLITIVRVRREFRLMSYKLSHPVSLASLLAIRPDLLIVSFGVVSSIRIGFLHLV